LKILKIHEIFCENPRIIFVLFYDVAKSIFDNKKKYRRQLTKILDLAEIYKENMFTINLEDGREAQSKASLYINLACLCFCLFVCNQ